MWKKIDEYNTIAGMNQGSIITISPENAEDHFEIKNMLVGYIWAMHAKKILLKVFPEEDLIRGDWWVKL